VSAAAANLAQFQKTPNKKAEKAQAVPNSKNQPGLKTLNDWHPRQQ
jgi:hypothetical protein